TLQVAFDLPRRTREIGDVVGAKQEGMTMRTSEPIARFVPHRLRLQAICDTAMRRWPGRRPAGRQQNRRRRADRALVREQHLVGTAAVAEMLVDVYNRLA